ncbi:putative terminase, ATPase subunit, gpP-like protein [Leptospira interrogans]|nr:putative terminase, ATPase subunit, gpP-like protein [Leptospira interrogans]
MMTESEFAEIVNSTRNTVLSAIEKNLAERFYYAIDDVAQETYFRAYKALKKINSAKNLNSVLGYIRLLETNP